MEALLLFLFALGFLGGQLACMVTLALSAWRVANTLKAIHGGMALPVVADSD